ncbi:hypothetical protein [Legionella micdadei]|uniref:hypothetical protein n=1 Tax=Legionella micdadei TaxID=451 RepID=UPI0009EF72AB|nr:hypothetical protein [Legionella micdadei]ARH00378.1 hypothetical protein B6V88_08040 [Legionella micdadei]
MFKDLPYEILVKICDQLNIKDERSLGFFSSEVKAVTMAEMQRRLFKVLQNPNPNAFCQFLECITSDEKIGYAILFDSTCKDILINKRPRTLPHWILSVAQAQPNLLQPILEDQDYLESLSSSEISFLLNNHVEKLDDPARLRAQLGRKTREPSDKSEEIDRIEESSSAESNVSLGIR